MIVRLIAKVLAVLNSNTRPVQVGAAVACGLLLALLPAANLVFVVALVIIFVVRVHLGMVIASGLVFSLLTPLIDPALNSLGHALLTLPRLNALLASAWQLPVVPLTRLDNTLVAGGLIAGLVLFAPVTLLGILLAGLYRKRIHPRFMNSKLVKAIQSAPWAQKLSTAIRSVRRVWPTVG